MRDKIYVVSNGESYEYYVYAIFNTREEADRYNELFLFPSTVEEWDIPSFKLPDDPDEKVWRFRYNNGKEGFTLTLGGLDHTHVNRVDGIRGMNRGTTVFAKTATEAIERAKALIERKDGK